MATWSRCEKAPLVEAFVMNGKILWGGYGGGMLFDSHNHLQSAKFGQDVGDLVKEMGAVGISGCVVNATREEDWATVAGLAGRFPGFVRAAYGVHPWFSDTVEEGWESRLRAVLENDPLATVGEIGVDGWVDSPSVEVQRTVFLKQVQIAEEMKRVMTVHCLKAWEPLFSVMGEVSAWPERFLMHSFGGSIEVAERLLERGAWFSFSGYFLEERKRKVLEVFKKLPVERILLETDAPEMMPPADHLEFLLGDGVNHPANLRKIGEEFSKQMGRDLFPQLMENSRIFWSLNTTPHSKRDE